METKSYVLHRFFSEVEGLEQENHALRQHIAKLEKEKRELLGQLTTQMQITDDYKLRWILDMAPGTQKDPLQAKQKKR